MRIQRQAYLDKLIAKQGNGLVKVVTGIRRCGKSFLLFELFHEYLCSSGVSEGQIIEIALDDRRNKALRDPDNMLAYLDSRMVDRRTPYYVIIDEVQMLDEFVDVLNSLLHTPNVDVYVTGSNSRFLATDVATEFRGRGDQIRVHPLSFAEFSQARGLDAERAWDEYLLYGGMPLILSQEGAREKAAYLISLLDEVYLVDIVERYGLRGAAGLEELVNVLASSIGSPTNPNRIADTFASERKTTIDDKTVRRYIDCLRDAFLLAEAKRFDIKGRRYIGSPSKYYFEDHGLRNACLNFRQIDEGHLMENVIYNELIRRGYSVDVGSIETFGKSKEGKTMRKQLEVDFVVNMGSSRCYIQSAWKMDTPEKMEQEKRSLLRLKDGFRRVLLVSETVASHYEDDGILVTDVKSFLLNQNSLEAAPSV